MWTPSMPEPCVKMLCHKGSVAALAIDRSGRYMATSGRDVRPRARAWAPALHAARVVIVAARVTRPERHQRCTRPAS